MFQDHGCKRPKMANFITIAFCFRELNVLCHFKALGLVNLEKARYTSLHNVTNLLKPNTYRPICSVKWYETDYISMLKFFLKFCSNLPMSKQIATGVWPSLYYI